MKISDFACIDEAVARRAKKKLKLEKKLWKKRLKKIIKAKSI